MFPNKKKKTNPSSKNQNTQYPYEEKLFSYRHHGLIYKNMVYVLKR